MNRVYEAHMYRNTHRFVVTPLPLPYFLFWYIFARRSKYVTCDQEHAYINLFRDNESRY